MPVLLDFELPAARIAGEPPEARGLARDEVRLMVSRVADDDIAHVRMRDLPSFLSPGDLLVVNASATINAALAASRDVTTGRPAEPLALHISSPLPDGRWAVEVRRVTPSGSAPFADVRPGDRLSLPSSSTATIVEPYVVPIGRALPDDRVRLWIAQLECADPGGMLPYLARYGSPIRYAYVHDRWPLDAYQTMFAAEPGSAEMPSAGRAFTPALVERLRMIGVRIARVVLHTGVASLERDEPPYPERFRVPPATASAVNRARADHRRVIAVGTRTTRRRRPPASTSAA